MPIYNKYIYLLYIEQWHNIKNENDQMTFWPNDHATVCTFITKDDIFESVSHRNGKKQQTTKDCAEKIWESRLFPLSLQVRNRKFNFAYKSEW